MNRIKDLREAAGMTQFDLAELLVCKPNTVHYYEKGTHGISQETIARLCKIFEVTADYLLGFSDIRTYTLSAEDYALIRAYHAATPNIQNGIRATLQPFWEVTPSSALPSEQGGAGHGTL